MSILDRAEWLHALFINTSADKLTAADLNPEGKPVIMGPAHN